MSLDITHPHKVIHTAPFAVAIMGNPSTAEFELVELRPEPVPEDYAKRFTDRGMFYLGLAGIQGGVPRISLDEPLTEDAVKTLSEAYLLHVESALNKQLAARVASEGV